MMCLNITVSEYNLYLRNINCTGFRKFHQFNFGKFQYCRAKVQLKRSSYT